MTELLQILFDALSLGSLYALGGLGIALIFGVMRLVNFAHGDFIAFCVFAMLWPSTNAAAIVFAGNLPSYFLIPLLLLAGAALSMLSEVIVFRRFRNANPATIMIASFALGFAIRNSVRGAGGYQMFGITPMPIYDPNQTISYLRDFMCLFKPSDIVKWEPIDRAESDEAVADVDAGRFAPIIRDVSFPLTEFNRDIDGYNRKLEGVLHGH